MAKLNRFAICVKCPTKYAALLQVILIYLSRKLKLKYDNKILTLKAKKLTI